MVSTWNEQAARYLLAKTICPRCDAELGDALVCPVCAADLSGPPAALVWRASQKAADAVLERQRLIETLPMAYSADSPAAPADTPATVVARSSAAAPRGDAASDADSQVSVQSVLAVAGAMFAVQLVVGTDQVVHGDLLSC